MNIFLCYPSAERATADQINLALVAQGHDVFFDRDDLPAGDEYHQRIGRAIEQSDVFIFLMTPDSLAKGRYTLTELDIAQAKWEHPAGHVLPVMVQPMPIKDVPPYLRAVTILEPKGDVAADVARAVSQLSTAGRRRKISTNLMLIFGIGLGLALLGAAALLVSNTMALKGEIGDQLARGRTQEQAQDYAAAWTTYEQANKSVQGHRLFQWLGGTLAADIAQARTKLAMQWLDNIRVPSGKHFADIIDPLLPALDDAISRSEGSQKGNTLAYRGWADFLRWRDGRIELKPDVYYQRAIEVDPSNAYAHVMWGHWVLWTGGDLADANRHFTQALTVAEHRTFVRDLQLAALGNRSNDECDMAQILVANDMRRGQEPLDATSRGRLYRIFESLFRPHQVTRESLTKLTVVAPTTDLLATYQWLFDEKEFPASKQFSAPYILGVLQAAAGQVNEARQTLEAFRSTLGPRTTYLKAVDDALSQLKKTSPTQ
ncbi:MAG: toll/interleukin-1 receptor domain-containing protein [Nitrospira sp.]|nr:MAG: toll/interleukin-1 receptor domain-containing protein [Nitrospira sp.]